MIKKILFALCILTLGLLTACSPSEPETSPEAPQEGSEQTSASQTERAESRLETVRERGKVVCASRRDLAGFGQIDAETGEVVGFDIDLCRAVAAAVLGDASKIEIREITASERGPTIQSGEVDLLVRTVTWTTSRDSQWGNFGPTMFYDGQGFLVRKDSGLSSALDLKGATVCVTQGTTTELNLEDFSRMNNLGIKPLTFEATDAVREAYVKGQCDSFTSDRSQVAALRHSFENKDDHIVLPETISEEPLTPVVPHGDDQWFDIVKTVMSSLIYAESYGISSDSIPAENTGNPKIDRLLGFDSKDGTPTSFGQESLGLKQTFVRDVITSVGNYGEIYERNIGSGGLNLPRGRNALWNDAACTDCPKGGQIYAAPLR